MKIYYNSKLESYCSEELKDVLEAEDSPVQGEVCEDPTGDELLSIQKRGSSGDIEIGDKFYCNGVGWMVRTI